MADDNVKLALVFEHVRETKANHRYEVVNITSPITGDEIDQHPLVPFFKTLYLNKEELERTNTPAPRNIDITITGEGTLT